MAKDAQSIKRSMYTGMAIALLVAALVFGYYLWNETVIHDNQTAN